MKSNYSLTIAVLSAFLLLGKVAAHAQGTDNYGAGMKINLDTTGKKFVRIITWH